MVRASWLRRLSWVVCVEMSESTFASNAAAKPVLGDTRTASIFVVPSARTRARPASAARCDGMRTTSSACSRSHEL
jgi:hypothetical protein